MDMHELLTCYELLLEAGAPQRPSCAVVTHFLSHEADLSLRKMALRLAAFVTPAPRLTQALLTVLEARNSWADLESVELAIKALQATQPTSLHAARAIRATNDPEVIASRSTHADLMALAALYQTGIGHLLDLSDLEDILTDSIWSPIKQIHQAGMVLARAACLTPGADTATACDILVGLLGASHPVRTRCTARAILWDALQMHHDEGLLETLMDLSLDAEDGLVLVNTAGAIAFLMRNSSDDRSKVLLALIGRVEHSTSAAARELLKTYLKRHVTAEKAATAILQAMFDMSSSEHLLVQVVADANGSPDLFMEPVIRSIVVCHLWPLCTSVALQLAEAIASNLSCLQDDECNMMSAAQIATWFERAPVHPD